MIHNAKQEEIIDVAWGQLYKRLEQDDLLPQQETVSYKSIFRSTPFRWAASVAILCLCAVSVWFVKQQYSSKLLVLHNESNAPTLATTLEDGSIVYLSEQSTLRYPEKFQADKRVITLRGKAYLDVSKQPERPFLIDTELAAIEVLGTYFSVEHNDPSSFLLSVRNGEVKVTLKKNKQIMYVKAGETVFLESGKLQLTKADIHQFDHCFDKIRFKDERLVDIVRIINLNSLDARLEVAPEVIDRRLTITSDICNETPETMANLICLALNLHYSQQNQLIYISP